MIESVNNNRQINIDLAKFLLVIFMILIHVMMGHIDVFFKC